MTHVRLNGTRFKAYIRGIYFVRALNAEFKLTRYQERVILTNQRLRF